MGTLWSAFDALLLPLNDVTRLLLPRLVTRTLLNLLVPAVTAVSLLGLLCLGLLLNFPRAPGRLHLDTLPRRNVAPTPMLLPPRSTGSTSRRLLRLSYWLLLIGAAPWWALLILCTSTS